ncbi:hypothetical protein [Candidatus Protochlamydia amoebophila]|uniref:Uncharacterized protein n=1 Tax=Candidatus Protochlamydia amoebophila TaxID=362787 RepID=A0A0C1JUR2_9BACT|nr:hypothetical protein [Candidatus Protochlamydia amoebophila]KIC71017.1 hypothetical protein DB44_EZ00090 [Candidatus Protochlamydia amoebophila]
MSSSLKLLLAKICPYSDYSLILDNRHFYSWKKPYLSYDSHKGWSLERLNIFQRIVRSLFKLYSHTHFSHIGWRLSRETDIDPLFIQNMQKCWETAYPKKICPFFTFTPYLLYDSIKEMLELKSVQKVNKAQNSTIQEFIIDHINIGCTTETILQLLKDGQSDKDSNRNLICTIGLIIDLHRHSYLEADILRVFQGSGYEKRDIQSMFALVKQRCDNQSYDRDYIPPCQNNLTG